MHVQNERKKKTETEGVKTPSRNNTDGKTNQIDGGMALFDFYSCRDCPRGFWEMQIRVEAFISLPFWQRKPRKQAEKISLPDVPS